MCHFRQYSAAWYSYFKSMFQGINSNKCRDKKWKLFKYGLLYCYAQILYLIQFSYFPVSWIFLGKGSPDKFKKLQRRALRFVFTDYTSRYSDMIQHGNFLFLSALRIRYLPIDMYKCVHGLHPPYLNELFKNKDTRCDLRDSNRLHEPEFQTVRYVFKSSLVWFKIVERPEVKKYENRYFYRIHLYVLYLGVCLCVCVLVFVCVYWCERTDFVCMYL